MASIIKFHGLSGIGDESPPCYLLQVDEFTFLLDCGWPIKCPEGVQNAYLKDFQKYVNRIDAVLLTHPDVAHLGALPYLMGMKVGLSCPVYATVPVHKMGQMFMYDFYLSKYSKEEFDAFCLDDVDFAFDHITQLKYNQTVNLKGKGYGISICPTPAGHMIGGTIWKIIKGEEDIYYAMDYNHKKERHLNGCELEKIQRPSLFITDAFNANYKQSRRRTRDEQLLSNILRTLRTGGNVLVTVDTAGRVLELSSMLDQLWKNKDSGLSSYSLILLNNVAFNVVEFSKLQIEWMSDKLMRTFEGARMNPFQFKHMHICHTIQEVNKIVGPKVVLASCPDLEVGFSRDLFIQWCSDSKNCIILTSRTSPGTLARILHDTEGLSSITLEIKKRVKLEGAELDEFWRQQREDEYRVKKEKREAMIDSDDSDSDDDMEIKVTGIYRGNHVNHDLFIKAGMETKVEAGLFRKSKSRYPLFPHFEEKIRFDEYGEFIKAEDFVINELPYEVGRDVKPAVHNAIQTNSFPETMEIPTKCLVSSQTVNVNCQIFFIDFEGRSDGESMQKIIEQMKPRRMIITRGSQEAVEKLEDTCSKFPDTKVFVPKKPGDIIDATTESHIYQVRLKDSLVSSLNFMKARDEAELAWIEGTFAEKNDPLNDSKNEEENMEIETFKHEQDQIPCLEPVPIKHSGHSTVFVNELKLSDFKQVLTKYGIPSEFSGGVLWCYSGGSGAVALRRQESNRLTVEGCLSDEYYVIRDLLYQQYAIL